MLNVQYPNNSTMCILFIYRNPNATGSAYRLIVASNRDETLRRSAKAAHYWKNHPDCLGGIDETPTKEGGTWLALSKKGRGSVVLNLSRLHNDKLLDNSTENLKKGRGSLVANYITSNQSASDYLGNLHEENRKCQLYHQYTLILFDLKTADVSFLCSSSTSTGPVLSVKDTVLGFGNTEFEGPYRKVTVGKEKFKKIVDNSRIFTKNEIIERLIKLLKSEEKHLPDELLKAFHPETYKSLSSIFLNEDDIDYITIAHSIILVDALNRVTFVEEKRNDDKTWTHQRFDATLH